MRLSVAQTNRFFHGLRSDKVCREGNLGPLLGMLHVGTQSPEAFAVSEVLGEEEKRGSLPPHQPEKSLTSIH